MKWPLLACETLLLLALLLRRPKAPWFTAYLSFAFVVGITYNPYSHAWWRGVFAWTVLPATMLIMTATAESVRASTYGWYPVWKSRVMWATVTMGVGISVAVWELDSKLSWFEVLRDVCSTAICGQAVLLLVLRPFLWRWPAVEATPFARCHGLLWTALMVNWAVPVTVYAILHWGWVRTGASEEFWWNVMDQTSMAVWAVLCVVWILALWWPDHREPSRGWRLS